MYSMFNLFNKQTKIEVNPPNQSGQRSKLHNMRVYLAGPMDRCPNGGIGWRKDITLFLQNLGLQVYNPVDKPIAGSIKDIESIVERKRRQKFKEDGLYAQFAKEVKVIRNIDLRMVDVSDFIIVNYDMNIQMCGTFEELFLANRQKKPILIHCPQGKSKVSDWLWACIPHEMFFSNWDELKNYLTKISTGKDSNTHGRWVFFDNNINS